MTSKVEERRNRRIEEAARQEEWGLVDHLLNQEYENIERKDRRYGLLSLNAISKNDGGQDSEIIDLYCAHNYNGLEQLINKEQKLVLNEALQKLSRDDLHILLGIALEGKSALQLTKETSFKSHKTVKNHYEATCKLLKEELGKYL
ncbi:sigma-70 family RNA polymerase sigma factor [Streptococcus sp. W151]